MSEDWGVYVYADSTYYKSDPPTEEAATRNLRLLDEAGEVVTDRVGFLMQNAVAHFKFNEWRKRNNL